MFKKMDVWITGGYVIKDGVIQDGRPWSWHYRLTGATGSVLKGSGKLPLPVDDMEIALKYAYGKLKEDVKHVLDKMFKEELDNFKNEI